MLVAPVENVVGEQVAAQPQRLDAAEQRRVRHLAMLQRMAVVRAGMRGQRPLQHLHRRLAGLVAIGVDMQ